MCLNVAWPLGTNIDEEMYAGTIVFKMAGRMHVFIHVCVHFCEFVMRILVLLYCHQLNGIYFLLNKQNATERGVSTFFITGFLFKAGMNLVTTAIRESRIWHGGILT